MSFSNQYKYSMFQISELVKIMNYYEDCAQYDDIRIYTE